MERKVKYSYEFKLRCIKEVLEQFEKENMGILTDMTVYQTNLLQFQQTIFIYSNSSWFNTYMDKNNPIVLKDTGEDRYIFVDSNAQYKADAENNNVTNILFIIYIEF